MKTRISRSAIRKRYLLGVLVIGIVIELAILVIPRLTRTKADRMRQEAKRIEAACRTSDYRPGCYDKEIPKRMGRYSMEDVFAITKLVQKADTSYAYCHVLGHALSAAETKKNPAKWQDVVARCPSGVCSNGCVHGAFQERFRRDTLTVEQISVMKPDLLSVCEARDGWQPTGMEQATCYHALGHLTMYITRADIPASTALCDEIAAPRGDRDFRNVCYDGVYMQMFQPLEPEDRALIRGREPTRQTVDALCDGASGAARASCVSESWPLYFDDITRPGFVQSHCGTLEPGFQERCQNGLYYVLVVEFRFDLTKIAAYCDGQPGPLRGRCLAQTASRLIETDWTNIEAAIRWCQGGRNAEAQKACFTTLAREASFQFPPDSPEFFSLCDGMPDLYGPTCMSGSDLYAAVTSGDLDPGRARAALTEIQKRWGSVVAYQAVKTVAKTLSSERQHELAHLFGELLYRVDGVEGVGVCDESYGFGCYHSFFGAAVADRGPGIVKSLDRICTKSHGVAGLGCPHGLGHGLGEFFGPSRIEEQLAFCGDLSWKGKYFGCAGGVFMEYFLPLAEGAVAQTTVRPFIGQDPYGVCSRVEKRFQPACFIELGGWWEHALKGDVEHMGELCQRISEAGNRESCFLGIGIVAASKTGYAPEAAVALCTRMPPDSELLCRAGASWGFFANPKMRDAAAGLCRMEDASVMRTCLSKADLLSM